MAAVVDVEAVCYAGDVHKAHVLAQYIGCTGTLAYATFANETLSNETTDNPGATSLVVGVNEKGAIVVPSSGTPNVLSQNMGFMNVTGVTDGLPRSQSEDCS